MNEWFYRNEVFDVHSEHDDSDNESVLSVCYSDSSDVENSCSFINENDETTSSETDSNIEEDDEEECTFSGKQIVDLNHIFQEIRRINTHSLSCSFNDMRLTKLTKMGFITYFRFVCRKCRYVHTLKTSVSRKDQFDLNYESVFGAMCIGIGFSQLQEFTGILDIPCMTEHAFRDKEKKVQVDLTSAVAASTKIIAEKEKKYATELGHVDENGTPLIKGIVDAAWSKRAYRSNYSALSGSAVIVGYSTKKVLWQGVANKFCIICKQISNMNEEPYDHDCNANYEGPSTGMESKLLVDGFKECEQTFGLRISEFIGDGDSSVISELHKANVYQNPTLKIVKTECCNHLFRNIRGNLRKLGEKGFLKNYLTTKKIEQIVKDIMCARKHWVGEDTDMERKIENLRNDIYNVPFHVFGHHTYCKDYFCTKKKSKDPDLVQIMKVNNSFNPILDALSRVRLNARSILLNESSNVAEHFNSLIVKYTGGKRVNYSKKQSFTGRTKIAVLQHNTGRAYSTLCEHMNKTPNSIAAENEFKRAVKNLWRNNRKRKFKPKANSGVDKNYGGFSCAKPDMTEENFNFEKTKFLERLNANQAVRIEIQEKTKSQHGSSEWKQYRSDLLTASNFGRVCCARSPQSFTGIVNSILYTDISNLKQVAHGSFYEKNAIKKLEELEGITVEKCGLFIDSEFSFLGATPDGIVGSDAIVEVKCPYSIFEKNIDESILNGKLTVWSRERKVRKKDTVFIPKICGINKRHKWYYQIQGQLHITRKDMCYFVVWVGDDFPIRVEKIYRDDNFWKKNMESQLINFYHTALLPEIIDPRISRSMSLRKYDANGNLI